MAESIPVTLSPALEGAVHGFFGRRGGVSDGIYDSLNVGLGSDDDGDAVRANRERIVAALFPPLELVPKPALVTVHQEHGTNVARATGPWKRDGGRRDPPRADALVSDTPGVLLGILAADCAPVLLCDSYAGVVGAAHAGWKGALAGVTDRTIEAMERLGAARATISAAIGPCIGQASYEVDEAYRDRFVADDSANARFFADGQAGRFQFDLEAYVAARLKAAGIDRVERVGHDTCAMEADYFSYRRATRAGEPDYGRQLSAISLPLDRA